MHAKTSESGNQNHMVTWQGLQMACQDKILVAWQGIIELSKISQAGFKNIGGMARPFCARQNFWIWNPEYLGGMAKT